MPRLLPIYIFISHLPPTSHTLMIVSKHTYIFSYILRPFYSNLLFPYVFSYVQIPAGCVSKHVYASPSSSIYAHLPHPHMYGLCCVVTSMLITIFLFSFFYFYKFHRHLCHRSHRWTHNLQISSFPICIFISLIYEQTNK